MTITQQQANNISNEIKDKFKDIGWNCWCNDCKAFFGCPTDSGGACRYCGGSNWVELTING